MQAPKNFSGDRLRAARIAAGLSRADVGDACGLTRWAVRAWELGEAAPRAKTIGVLAHLLSLEPGDLFVDTAGVDADAA